MELTVHPLLTLVDDNKNGLKLLLKNYIDSTLVEDNANVFKLKLKNYIYLTVEQQFDLLKSSIGEMIATGQIGPQCNDSALPYTQTTFPTGQSNVDTPNSSILHHSNDQLPLPSSQHVSTITISPVIKQECVEEDSSTTIPINFDCNDAPNDIDNNILENIGIYSSVHADSQDDFEEEAFDDDQILQTNQQNNKPHYASIVQSTMYHSNYQLTTNQITLPPTNQLQTSTKQSNLTKLNENCYGSFIKIKEEIVDGDDNETAKQNETNQDDRVSYNPFQKQKVDTTRSFSGQSPGQSPIQKKQVNNQIQSNETVIQQSIQSTSGLSLDRNRIPKKTYGKSQSNGEVKSGKRKSNMTQSSEAVKKVKQEDVDKIQQEQEIVPQIVTLELNCTEPSCNSILKSVASWRNHLWMAHRKPSFKHLYDNVRANQFGQTEYPCTDCDVVCLSQDLLIRHWTNTHQTGKFQCSVCSFEANLWCEVFGHQQQNHHSTNFQCTYQGCSVSFKTNFDLEQHQQFHRHDKRQIQTKQVVNNEIQSDGLANEIQQEQETAPQIVTLKANCTEPGCMKILDSFEMWKQHLSNVHGRMPFQHLEDNVRYNQLGQTEYPCTDCESVFTLQDSLNRHWKNCHIQGSFQCSTCEFMANYRCEIRNHYQKNHYSGKFECTHEGCGKAFKSPKQLENHARIHSGETPFKCIFGKCPLNFNRLETAISHVRTQHFHLPKTVKEQRKQNIIDERDPKVYVRVLS